ncbi:MAG: hypothetical protein QM811_21850 [Pirellulales bacterium]
MPAIGPALGGAAPMNAVPGSISSWQPADPARWRNNEPGTILPTSSPSPGTLPAPIATVAQTPLPPFTVVRGTAPAPLQNPTPQYSAAPAGTTPSVSQPPLPPPSGSFQSQYDALESDLAAVIMQDPNAWNLAELNQRSDALYQRTESSYEKGKVRIYQAKLARFGELRQRTLDQQALLAARPIPGAARPAPGASPYPMPPRSTEWTPNITPATPYQNRTGRGGLERGRARSGALRRHRLSDEGRIASARRAEVRVGRRNREERRRVRDTRRRGRIASVSEATNRRQRPTGVHARVEDSVDHR